MKTLFLTRHAKTIPGESGISDFDRKLTSRGPKDIVLVAKELISLEYEPDLIISSPALRARQTAVIFAKAFNYPEPQIKILNYLYSYFNVNQLIEDIAKMAPKARSVQLIGHNPSISEMGADLSASFLNIMPTSATLVIDFEVVKWEFVTEGSGILSQYIYPSAIRDPNSN